MILCALVIFPFIDDSDVLPFSAIDKKNRCLIVYCLDMEIYFFHESDMLEWFAKYGISAGSYDELERRLDSDYVCVNLYDTICA